MVAVSGFWMATFCAAAALVPADGGRVVEQDDHSGSGAAADQRARDQAGDPDPQPARATPRRRLGDGLGR